MKRYISFVSLLLLLVGDWCGATVPAASVIQVTKTLPMHVELIQAPRDIFINLGAKDSVRIGDRFLVYRMTTAVNELTGHVRELVPVELGEIKILSVGGYTAIGRVTVENSPRELPNIDYPVIMVGDKVEKVSADAELSFP